MTWVYGGAARVVKGQAMFASRLIHAIGDAVRQDSTGHFQDLQAQDLTVGNLAVDVRYRVTSCSILLY